jgi:hypothetical protein
MQSRYPGEAIMADVEFGKMRVIATQNHTGFYKLEKLGNKFEENK